MITITKKHPDYAGLRFVMDARSVDPARPSLKNVRIRMEIKAKEEVKVIEATDGRRLHVYEVAEDIASEGIYDILNGAKGDIVLCPLDAALHYPNTTQVYPVPVEAEDKKKKSSLDIDMLLWSCITLNKSGFGVQYFEIFNTLKKLIRYSDCLCEQEDYTCPVKITFMDKRAKMILMPMRFE
jgi:hypothetical protein